MFEAPLPAPQRKHRLQTGFGAIDVLAIVIGIVLLVVVAPALLRPRHPGGSQESSAVAQLRTINTAEVTYLSSAGGQYGSVPELITAGLLDSRFAGSVSGYTFGVMASGTNYTATATPASTNAGRYGYYSTPDAVIRWATATAATCTPCFPAGQSGSPVQ
jgi:hypothetical protein